VTGWVIQVLAICISSDHPRSHYSMPEEITVAVRAKTAFIETVGREMLLSEIVHGP